MNTLRKTVSCILLAAMLSMLILLPQFAGKLIDGSSALDWLRPKREAFGGVISVWHVVRFKPFVGSLGSWLKKYAETMEKRHFGVYFEVESIAEDEAIKRLEAGEFPDAVSFPYGMPARDWLIEPEGESRGQDGAGVNGGEAQSGAAAFAASCEVILFYPEALDISPDELGEEIARECSYSDFKAGKAPFCIADIGAAGEMSRLLSANKAEHFEIMPFQTETPLVQFIGAANGIAAEKLPYVREYIELLCAPKAQTALLELGLMPVNADVQLKYEQSFLSTAYGLIAKNGGLPENPFE